MWRAQEQNKKHKGITQLALTSQCRQTGAILWRISWNITSEMVFIFCFLNQLCFQGEEDRNRRWIATWIGPAFHDTLHKSRSAICITLPSFGTVKDIINLQYNWLFKTVWFPEGCVLQWQECSLENFENTPEEYMNLVMRVWLKFI